MSALTISYYGVVATAVDWTLKDVLALSQDEMQEQDSIQIMIRNEPLTTTTAQVLLDALRSLAGRPDLAQLRISFWITKWTDWNACRRLLEGLTVLKGVRELALRLSGAPHPRLFSSKALRNAVDGATGRPTIPSKPFPFMRLPPELRLRVYGFTDLDPYHRRSLEIQRSADLMVYTSFSERFAHPYCCDKCRPPGQWQPHCFCRVGAAYSSRCTCAETPVALFRTSRLVRDECIHYFYTRNKFIFNWRGNGFHRGFLSRLPADGTFAIRRLEIWIWYKQLRAFANLETKRKITKTFRELVAVIASKLDVPQLRLTILTQMRFKEDVSDPDDTSDLSWVPGAQLNVARLLKPLGALRGLELFFAHGAELEDEAEKMVMGPHYSAVALGKLHWSRRTQRWPYRERHEKPALASSAAA